VHAVLMQHCLEKGAFILALIYGRFMFTKIASMLSSLEPYWTQSYKENFRVNLLYARIYGLLLAGKCHVIIYQPSRILKFKRTINLL